MKPSEDSKTTKHSNNGDFSGQDFSRHLEVLRIHFKREVKNSSQTALRYLSRPFRGEHALAELPYNAEEFKNIRRAFDTATVMVMRSAAHKESPELWPITKPVVWHSTLEEALRLTMLRVNPRWINAQLLQPVFLASPDQRTDFSPASLIRRNCGEQAWQDAAAWHDFKAYGRPPSGWPAAHLDFFSNPDCGFEHKKCLYTREDWSRIRQAWTYTLNILDWKLRASHPEHLTPATTHAMQVAMLLAQSRQPADLIIAGLLHDAREDVLRLYPVVMREIEDLFGSSVRSLIERVSEPRKPGSSGKRSLDDFFGCKYNVLSQCRTRQSSTLLAASKISTLEDGIRFVEAWGRAGVLKWSRGDYQSNLACFETTRTHLSMMNVCDPLLREFSSRLDEFRRKARPHCPLIMALTQEEMAS